MLYAAGKVSWCVGNTGFEHALDQCTAVLEMVTLHAGLMGARCSLSSVSPAMGESGACSLMACTAKKWFQVVAQQRRNKQLLDPGQVSV